MSNWAELIDLKMKNKVKYMCPLLNVFDMHESLKFYTSVLDFTIKEQAGPPGDIVWVILEWNEIELMLNSLFEKAERPWSRNKSQNRYHSDTALYFNIQNIDVYYEYLCNQDILVNPPYITPYGFKAINFKDPDGYTIVFHWPVDRR